MSMELQYLPEATLIIAMALLVVTLAIFALRKLQTLLIVAAVVIAIGWGIILFPKYKDRISLPDFPQIHTNLPTFEIKP